jgi:hypothetical protein
VLESYSRDCAFTSGQGWDPVGSFTCLDAAPVCTSAALGTPAAPVCMISRYHTHPLLHPSPFAGSQALVSNRMIIARPQPKMPHIIRISGLLHQFRSPLPPPHIDHHPIHPSFPHHPTRLYRFAPPSM